MHEVAVKLGEVSQVVEIQVILPCQQSVIPVAKISFEPDLLPCRVLVMDRVDLLLLKVPRHQLHQLSVEWKGGQVYLMQKDLEVYHK